MLNLAMFLFICLCPTWLFAVDCSNYCCQSSSTKVCVDSDTGAIAWLGTPSGSNLVDLHDYGRYIQSSFYRHDSPDNVNDWNPIEEGDSCGNKAAIVTTTDDGSTLYTKTNMRHWFTAWGCILSGQYLEKWITVQGDTVKVRNRYQYTDGGNYGTVGQEAPAIYLVPYNSFNYVSYYGGASPWTSGALTSTAYSNGACINFTPTERWTAITNNTGSSGVGVFYPTLSNSEWWSCDPASETTSYSALTTRWNVVDQAVLDWSIYFAVGSVTNIRAAFKTVHDSLGMSFPWSR